MYLSDSELHQLVVKLKQLHQDLYSLPVEDFTDFVRLRSNLLAEGVLITNEMLELPEDQLVELIKRQLDTHSKERSVDEDVNILKRLTSVDVERFDEDRARMRKSLFGSSIKVTVTHSGKSFSVNMGTAMKNIRINVPADWDITMSQGLLLQLYDKTFKDILPQVDVNDLASVIGILALRYHDYAMLRKFLEFDAESNRPDNIDLDKASIVDKLRMLGYNDAAIFVLTKLIDLYRINRLSMAALLKTISPTGRTRRRLLITLRSLI